MKHGWVIKIRRAVCLFMLFASVFSLWGCKARTPVVTPTLPADSATDYALRAAVLYWGEDDSWRNTYDYLQQSTLLNLSVDPKNTDEDFSADGYDVLYLDCSVANAPNALELSAAIEAYVADGGAVVLDNALYGLFDPAFLGVREFIKLSGCPTQLEFPSLDADLTRIQSVISDFAGLYPSFADYETLSQQDYGYGAVCDTAVSLVNWGQLSLYMVNYYKNGLVFFLNPLLPNAFSISGFNMEPRIDGQLPFSNTTAGCNQLLVNALAGYVAQQRYGYYLGRVFGSFGSPDMAWELHYEEITGIENDSMKTFSELCQEYLQIPSFVLIRNSYQWFLRAESVCTYLNEGSDTQPSFSMDLNENAYSTGTHVVSGNAWLSLTHIERAGSYFYDDPQYTQRAYPEACDYNEDGLTDLLCGSSDGNFYYYAGKGYTNHLLTAKAQALTDLDGNVLSVSGYSAPCLADVNGDGSPDLISGSTDGKLYWFAGNGTLQFAPMGVLLETGLTGQSLPAAGDLNGDGITDLAVGSNEGELLIYYGRMQSEGVSYESSWMQSLSSNCANAQLGQWLSPELYDRDGDGTSELLVGTFDGYVALFDGELRFADFLTTGELNIKGNYNLKNANNCVPVLYDLNGDNAADLLCGALEYGLAYPIDSPYFPYASQLRDQLAYAVERDYYMGIHFYTNTFASEKREAAELKNHLEAMEAFGAQTEGIGLNQHTWYTSALSPSQSLQSAWKAGMLWNSGFSPASASFSAPQSAAENVVCMPFFLTQNNSPTLLVQNCSVLPYNDAARTDISGRHGMPVCVYYHCDFVYDSDVEARDYMQKLSDFWWKHGYNFTSEDQLMTATAASYNLFAQVHGNLEEGMAITPATISDSFALYDAAYQASSGIKVVMSKDIGAEDLTIDADVWRQDGSTIYLGLNRSVSIRPGAASGGTHLERVNIAAEVSSDANGATVRFLDGGMLQAVVSGPASAKDDGWIITERDGKTIFTKYGGADTLRIVYKTVQKNTQ